MEADLGVQSLDVLNQLVNHLINAKLMEVEIGVPTVLIGLIPGAVQISTTDIVLRVSR